MPATTLPPLSCRASNELGYEELILSAPSIGRRQPGELGKRLLGADQRRFGALQTDVRRHAVPHPLAQRLARPVGAAIFEGLEGQSGWRRETLVEQRPERAADPIREDEALEQ